MDWKDRVSDKKIQIVPEWFVKSIDNNIPKAEVLPKIRELCANAYSNSPDLSKSVYDPEWEDFIYELYLDLYKNG